MKLLWHSHAPFKHTGYGIPTRYFTQLAAEAGIDVRISAFNGVRGKVLNNGPIAILPGGLDAYGNDLLPIRVRQWQPDATVCFHDIWTLQPETLRAINAIAYTPVDSVPLDDRTRGHLLACKYVWTYSRFGERELRKAGFDPFYVPLGHDGEMFKPVDRVAVRQQIGLADNTLFAVFVGSNLGNPSRKSVDRILKAWGKFIETHPHARLYMHTNPLENDGGFHLLNMAKFYGIAPQHLEVADSYTISCGMYQDATLAAVFNAADVVIAPSRAEGFGMVLTQAQACGCPVITTDFSSMSELCFGGYKIPVDPLDGLEWTPKGAEQANITPDQIATALEWAADQKGNEVLRHRAAEGAKDYDFRHVFGKYMLPVLKYIAAVKPSQTTQEVAA